MNTITPINRYSIAEQITQSVEEYITSNRLSPGTKLPSEREFTAMLGCSRPALREAMKSLEATGIVETKVGKGVFVSEVGWSDLAKPFSILMSQSEDQFRCLLEARLIIETALMELVVDRMTDEDISMLEEIVNRFETSETEDEDVRIEIEFHTVLINICGNPLLAGLTTLVRDFYHNSVRDEIVKRIPSVATRVGKLEHEKLLDALRHRDHNAANLAMREHFRDWQKYIER